MLVHFALDIDDLGLSSSTPRHQKTALLDLIGAWADCGILRFDGDSYEKSQLKRAIDQLPGHLSSIWERAIKKHKMMPGPRGWPGLSEATLIEPGACGDSGLDLAGLCNCCGIKLGLKPPSTGSRWNHALETEIVFVDCLHHASPFENARKLSRGFIEAGMPQEKLWKHRIAPLAAVSKSVRIVDRYTLPRARQHQKDQKDTGLGEFLRRLLGTARLTRVSVYSSIEPDQPVSSYEASLELVLRSLDVRPVQALEVFIVGNSAFGRSSHERCIMFDDWSIEIGTGLEAFENDSAQTRSQCFMIPKSAVHKRKIAELQIAATHKAEISTYHRDCERYSAFPTGFVKFRVI